MNSLTFYTKCFCILLGGLWLVACPRTASAQPQSDHPPQSAAEAESQGYAYQFPTMGTLFTLKAYSSDASQVERLFQQAEKRVNEIAAVLTNYEAESETRQLTTKAKGKHAVVSQDLWNVLTASDLWHARSQGTFDSSLGNLTALWRKSRQTGARGPSRMPTEDQIQLALQNSGWNHVKLDPVAKSVCLSGAGVKLDFGAIGKGYAVDEAFKILTDGGLTCCLVNVSGNMRLGAPPPERAGWRIEIAPLEKDGQPLRRIEVAHCGVATSGDLWQYIMVDGQRRSHILDSRTGRGILGPIAATVIAPTATDADACATAACILGFEQLQEQHQTLGGYAILLAGPTAETAQAETHTTASAEHRILTLGDFPPAIQP